MKTKLGIILILMILTVSTLYSQTLFDDHSLYVPSVVDYGSINLIFHEDLRKAGLSKSFPDVFEPFYFRFGELPSSWKTDVVGYTFTQKYLPKKSKISEAERIILSQNIQLPEEWTDKQKAEFRDKLFSSKSISKTLKYNILIIFDIDDLQRKIIEAVKNGDLISTEIKENGKMLYVIKSISSSDRQNGLYCILADENRLIASNSKTLIIRSLAAGRGEINSLVADQEFKEIKDKILNNCFRWRIDRMPYAMLNRLYEIEAAVKDNDSMTKKLMSVKDDIENGMHWSIESYIISNEKVEKQAKYYFGSEIGAKKYFDRMKNVKKLSLKSDEEAHREYDELILNKNIIETVITYNERKLKSHKAWYEKTRSMLIELRNQELGNDK